MLLERPELRECLLADVAGEGPLAAVAPQVRVVRVLVQERLAALLALPRLHACAKKVEKWDGLISRFSYPNSSQCIKDNSSMLELSLQAFALHTKYAQ